MTSLFKRQPEMLDTTKKVGSSANAMAGNNNNNNSASNNNNASISRGSGSNLAAAGLAMMADKPLAPDDIDSVPESWVAVNAENNSGCEMSISNRDSRLSPVSVQSPHVEFDEQSLEQVKYRLVKDMIGQEVAAGAAANKSSAADWLWDWTSRGTATEKGRNIGNAALGSTLTTPPNSPEASNSDDDFKSPMRRGKHRGKRWSSAAASHNGKIFDLSVLCRLDVLLAILVSNLITGAVVYYCMSRMGKAQTAEDPFAQTINKYFW